MSVIRDSISRRREIAAATAKPRAARGRAVGKGRGFPAGPETWARPGWDKARQRSLRSKYPLGAATATTVLCHVPGQRQPPAPNQHKHQTTRRACTAAPRRSIPITQPRASPLHPQAYVPCKGTHSLVSARRPAANARVRC
ncbi:hypothetical protein S40285_10261 [Stachybotrys chlorohalonatus IBT 40285]|uniref:Uncharacterized protein n=1 Tax=Stachybotrys chlorohalonatus (strain IBT 40285) TaxID=1283841 RepID=A0A084QUM3_STAC4|nr:hypothetical protein S40285_10261 [Stachybotrys chlorohalonata IBT 40285]